MKLLRLLISQIFIISLVNGYCIKCFENGEKCYYKPTYDTFRVGGCGSGYICGPLNNQTTEENYICRPLAKLNEACFQNDIFESNMCDVGLVCQKGKCINARFAMIGEVCQQQSDCSSDYATCTNNVCTNPTNECIFPNDCGYDQFCQNGVCASRIQKGNNCTKRYYEMCSRPLICQLNYLNDFESGTCQPIIVNGIGGTCQGSINCNSDDGLYCQNDICQEYVEPVQKGNCTIRDSFCDDLHDCDCEGKCYPDSTPHIIKTSYRPIDECMFENQCVYTDNTLSSSSCVSRKCGPEQCEYLKASLQDSTLCSGFSYYVDQYCKTNVTVTETTIVSTETATIVPIETGTIVSKTEAVSTPATLQFQLGEGDSNFK
ncbi:hypothetical protein ACTA71_007689 [Dictyostelium dimigraforme]